MTKKQLRELANAFEEENKKLVKHNETLNDELERMKQINSEFEKIQAEIKKKTNNSERKAEDNVPNKQINLFCQIASGITLAVFIIFIFSNKTYNPSIILRDIFTAIVFAVSAFFAVFPIFDKKHKIIKWLLLFVIIIIFAMLFLNAISEKAIFPCFDNTDILLDTVAILSLFITILNNIKEAM